MNTFDISKEAQATMNWKQRVLFHWYQIFPPAPVRLELRCVTRNEGERLLRSHLEGERWRLAREEDTNQNWSVVFLERVELPARVARRRITSWHS